MEIRSERQAPAFRLGTGTDGQVALVVRSGLLSLDAMLELGRALEPLLAIVVADDQRAIS